MDIAKTFSSFPALKGASSVVVVGTAVAQRYSIANLGSGPVGSAWTTTEVQIETALKGSPGQVILVRQLGGRRSDGTKEVVDQFPGLVTGQRYVLFLTPSPFPGEYYPVGAFQGVFPVDSAGLVSSISPAAAAIGVALRGVPLEKVVHDIRFAPDLNTSP